MGVRGVNGWQPPMAGSTAPGSPTCSQAKQLRLAAACRAGTAGHCMQQLPPPALATCTRTCTASPSCRLKCSQAGVSAQRFSTNWRWMAVETVCTAGLRPPPWMMLSTSCSSCRSYQRAGYCEPACVTS